MSRTIRPQARREDLIVQPAADELLVFDRGTDKAYVLNLTATAVWRASNGKRTVPEIATYLSRETPTSESTVWYALGQLQDLLEEPVTLPHELVDVSRRKFLKMSGAVAAGVAVPVVINIIAPTPAHAQSATCFAPGTCVDFFVVTCAECCSADLRGR